MVMDNGMDALIINDDLSKHAWRTASFTRAQASVGPRGVSRADVLPAQRLLERSARVAKNTANPARHGAAHHRNPGG